MDIYQSVSETSTKVMGANNKLMEMAETHDINRIKKCMKPIIKQIVWNMDYTMKHVWRSNMKLKKKGNIWEQYAWVKGVAIGLFDLNPTIDIYCNSVDLLYREMDKFEELTKDAYN